VPGSILVVVRGPALPPGFPHGTAGEPRPAAGLAAARYRRIVATKAERRAAHEQVSACHQAQVAELLSHIGAAIDRYRGGEIDAYAVDETIHQYHRVPQNCGRSASPTAAAPTPSSPPASPGARPPTQNPSTGGNAPHRHDTNNHHRTALPARVPRLRQTVATPPAIERPVPPAHRAERGAIVPVARRAQ
jgi:hypothetical protein